MEKGKVEKDLKLALGRVNVILDELWRKNIRIIRVPEEEGNNIKEMKNLRISLPKSSQNWKIQASKSKQLKGY